MSKVTLVAMFICSCFGLVFAQDDYHKIEVSGGYSLARTDGFTGDRFALNSAFNGSVGAGARTVGTSKRKNLNGFDASVTYNFTRYVGAKFDVSGHYGSDSILLPSPVFSGRGAFIFQDFAVVAPQRNYNFLGGVQFKNNSKKTRLKPFAHALFGASRQSISLKAVPAGSFTSIIYANRQSISNTGFAMALGGGLDIRVSHRLDIRVFQFDYNPFFSKDQKLISAGDGRTFPTLNGGAPLTSVQDVTIEGRRQDGFRIGFGVVFH